MSIIVIHESFINRGIQPQELVGVLDPTHWNFICQQMNEVAGEANCNACLLEGLACCLCAFPLICCHPCVARQFEIYKRQESLHQINIQLFNGAPVLAVSADGVNLIVNTTFLNPANTISVVALPAYVPAQYAQSAVYTSATIVNPSYAAPPSRDHNPRTMNVTIPENCPPGSLLTVMSPSGQQVQITCPIDAKAGQNITVTY